MRNFGRLTRLGVLGPKVRTRTRLRRGWQNMSGSQGRVHPVNVLVALRTYASGHGRAAPGGGAGTAVTDALDAAFYRSARWPSRRQADGARPRRLRVDTSPVSGLPLTCREAAAARATVTAATEPKTAVMGFTGLSSCRWTSARGCGWTTPSAGSPG